MNWVGNDWSLQQLGGTGRPYPLPVVVPSVTANLTVPVPSGATFAPATLAQPTLDTALPNTTTVSLATFDHQLPISTLTGSGSASSGASGATSSNLWLFLLAVGGFIWWRSRGSR